MAGSPLKMIMFLWDEIWGSLKVKTEVICGDFKVVARVTGSSSLRFRKNGGEDM